MGPTTIRRVPSSPFVNPIENVFRILNQLESNIKSGDYLTQMRRDVAMRPIIKKEATINAAREGLSLNKLEASLPRMSATVKIESITTWNQESSYTKVSYV